MTAGNGTGGCESAVLFKDSSGRETKGVLRRVSRHVAVFELYGETPSLRLSEVLSNLRIVLNGDEVYTGSAVVTSVIDTGTGCVCQADLEPTALDRFQVGGNGRLCPSVADGFAVFLQHWQRHYRVLTDYKVAVVDLRSFLEDLRLWLQPAQLSLDAVPPHERAGRELAMAAALADRVVPAISGLFQEFEQAAAHVEPEAVAAHRAFGQTQLHSLLLRSPFVRRTYVKPLGYAGDYEMVNMMFRDPYEGTTLFGRLINAYALQLPPIHGHRNRVAMLTETLAREALRLRSQNHRFRVLSLGCGAAHEVQRFLAESALADISDFVLVDFDQETLTHTERVLGEMRRRFSRQSSLTFVKQSAQQFVARREDACPKPLIGRFDLAYCAGLFDYLSDRLCERLLAALYELLRPGGLLIVTNVDDHSARHEMECFLEWHLIYRNQAQLRQLLPGELHPQEVTVRTDASGVNAFMEIRKPEDGRKTSP